MTLPSLRSGHGLPSRQVALCDGRTSLRLSAQPAGFDLLTHYAPDSWFGLARVLFAPSGRYLSTAMGTAMDWSVDGLPHAFEWMEVWPFGYTNREERFDSLCVSSCLVTQGTVVWELRGVEEEAVLSIPRALFHVYGDRDEDGTPLSVCRWELGLATEQTGRAWLARRAEEWLFRDASTYAGIQGETVPSESRTSELVLAFSAATSLAVTEEEDVLRFRVTPAADGVATLALALDRTSATAAVTALHAAEGAAALWQEQRQRYAEVGLASPGLAFGRHTALTHFFDLEPHYLESMRIADDPGLFRANNDYYWVWGWDMTRPAFSLLCGNRGAWVKQLLDHRAEHGCINQYDNTLRCDLRVDSHLPGALELMLMHDYLAWTGDHDGSRAWQGAVCEAAEALCANPDPTGLSAGTAASTDFPEEFGRTFKAWLAYGAGWSYGGHFAAEKLLLRWGEGDLAARVRAQAMKIRRSFTRLFWNESTGFWNEGVHPTDPDLVCDIPLSTALSAMDSPYGEDLYAGKLQASARYAARHFLREDGVHITARNEVRGWKEWTRQPNNWFAANDTMLARLFRTVGDLASLETLFYLYEINFGYQPAAFEGKPFRRPLQTSGSWQAFGAGAWYRNLVEAAAGLWVDLGGVALMPGGLGEAVRLQGLEVAGASLDFAASGQGLWPARLVLDGKALVGTTKLPPLAPGAHALEVAYSPAVPPHPLLTLAVDAEVREAAVDGLTVTATLQGQGYAPLSFFSPGAPAVTLDGEPLPCEWDETTGRGRSRTVLAGNGPATLVITSA